MSLEEAKTHIGRNFDLDLSACIQGRTFQRSASISQTTSTTDDTSICANALSGVASCLPSGQSVCGSSEISPSPLSSATDSPLPTSMAFTPRLNATLEEHGGDPSSPSPSSSSATANDVQSVTTNALDPAETERTVKHYSTTALTNPLVIPELDALFQQPAAHRTVNVLSHLLDSRLPASWREPLLTNRRTLRLYSVDVTPIESCHFTPEAASSTTRADSPTNEMASETCLLQRQIPDEGVKPVKRSKQDGCYSKMPSDLPQPASDLKEHQNPSSPPYSFVSPNLVNCARQLADQFESRYRNKLGNLLDDVAGLSGTVQGEDTDTTLSLESADSSEDVKAQSSSLHPVVPPVVADGCPPTKSTDLAQTMHPFRERLHAVLYELFDERINWGRIVAMLAFVRALCEVVESRPLTVLTDHKQAEPQGTSDESTTDFRTIFEDVSDGVSDVALDVPDSAVSSRPLFDEHQQRARSVPANLPELVRRRPRAAHYVAWTAEFIHQPNGIWNWISANGGWDGLIDFEHGHVPLASSHLLGEDAFIMTLLRADDETLRLLRRAVTGVATLAVGAVGLVAAFRYFSKSA